MSLSPEHLAFVEASSSAAMITVAADGVAKPARVAVNVVDGKIWSSGTETRVRTARLRADPRCTLFVFENDGPRWLGLETLVRILDGPDAPAIHLRLFRQLQGKPTGPLSWFGGEYDDDAFLALMAEEGRVMYEFDVRRSYGLVY